MNDSVGIISYILTKGEILSCLIESIQWFSFIASRTELQNPIWLWQIQAVPGSSLPIKKTLLPAVNKGFFVDNLPDIHSFLFFPRVPEARAILVPLTRIEPVSFLLVCSFKVSSRPVSSFVI